MTSDTVPEDMAFPLLRSIGLHEQAHEKTGGEGVFAAGGRTARLRGEGKSGARVEQAVLRRRLGICVILF
ncbi:hypothetical protein [Dyella sp. 2RAB6]|uniref:hypothetical protein n=1 Tax=Dyella sp. 2RAB6 TaxID=3232992 RepID=UPI003F918E97